MARMTGGRAVVEAIRTNGSPYAFCVPGESFLPIMDAYYDYDDVHLISARHEEGAVFMAEGWAKATGRVGVAMATRGVGAGNLSIGVHTAYQDSTPLVVLLGQIPTRFKYREAFQEIDMDRFFGPIAKMVMTIDRTERIPELMYKAFRVAQSGRPGPVVVALPEDITSAEADFPSLFPPKAEAPLARPDEGAVREAVDRLLAAERPVILAGGGVLRAGATGELVALAEAAGVPVYSAFRRFDVFPNTHPLYAGSIGFGIIPAVLDRLRQADLVLGVGTRFSEMSTAAYSLPRPGTDIIHIDASPEVVGAVYPPVLGIVSDARLALQDLLAEVRKRGYETTESCQTRRTRARAEQEAVLPLITPRPFLETVPVDPEGVVYALQQILPPDAAIVHDAGNFAGWPARYFRWQQPGTHFGATAGAMGYGLPAAIGVKLATPNRPVICLAGDGGFLMTLSELETATRVGANVVSLVFNNHMYGTIRMHQEKHFPGRQIGTALGNPSFAGLAREFGCHAERVERTADFGPALRRALEAGRPAVLELMTRPERLTAGASTH